MSQCFRRGEYNRSTKYDAPLLVEFLFLKKKTDNNKANTTAVTNNSTENIYI